MATRIFLGEPPARIKQWIIDHYGIPNMERLPILTTSNFNPDSQYTTVMNSYGSMKGNILYKDLIDNIIKWGTANGIRKHNNN